MRVKILLGLLIIAILIFLFQKPMFEIIWEIKGNIEYRLEVSKSMNELTEIYGLETKFQNAGISYPPQQVIYLGIKDKHILELWAKNDNGFKLIKIFPEFLSKNYGFYENSTFVKAENVPEGVFDLFYSRSPYDPILILQGSTESSIKDAIQCHEESYRWNSYSKESIWLPSIELSGPINWLDVLTYEIGPENVTYIISSTDLREGGYEELIKDKPAWLVERYKGIREELTELR